MVPGHVPGLPGRIPRRGELSSGGTRVPKETAAAELRGNPLPHLCCSKAESKPRPVPLVWESWYQLWEAGPWGWAWWGWTGGLGSRGPSHALRTLRAVKSEVGWDRRKYSWQRERGRQICIFRSHIGPKFWWSPKCLRPSLKVIFKY